MVGCFGQPDLLLLVICTVVVIKVRFAHVIFDVAEVHVKPSVRAAPIGGVDSLCHPAVKRGWFPITRAFDVAMFDGVVVDVVEMPFEIILVLEGMFPKSRLPDTSSAFAATSLRDGLLRVGEPSV